MTMGVKKKWHYIIFIVLVFCLFRAVPVAHRGSQARSGIGAVAAGLRHSHSNARSKLHLRPTPQLVATPGPYPPSEALGSNLRSHGC